MFSVYRWFKVSGEDCTELVGVFPDETTADQFCVFYAMLHMISVDDLDIGYCESVSLEKLIDEVMSK